MSHMSLESIGEDILTNVFFPLDITNVGEHQATISVKLPSSERILKFSLVLPSKSDAHPKLVPLSYLPGPEFCFISALHCETQKKYAMSSSFSFGVVLNAALCHLIEMDQSLLLPRQPVLGGEYASVTENLRSIAIESIVAELYCEYQHVIIPKPSNVQDLSKTFAQSIDFAALKNNPQFNTSRKADNLQVFRGTGYSCEDDLGYGRNRVTMGKAQKLVEHISQRMQVVNSHYVQQHKHDKSLEWLLTSPLLEILCAVMREFSSEEVVRKQAYVGKIVSIVSRLEMLHSMLWRTPKMIQYAYYHKGMADRSSDILKSLTFVYKLVCTAVEKDLIEEEPPWLSHLKKFSKGYSEVASSATAPTTATPSPALKYAAVAVDSKEQTIDTLSERVIYVTDLETHHSYSHKIAAGEARKVPRAWLKELKTIAENLPECITLFVAENTPQICVASLNIQENQDVPYFGATFVFDLFIPDTYPAEPPKVQFCTTGRGSVRFNPNLYENGNVCLSLLGTWAGEPWDPKQSNITQVLKSMLYLIFVEEPYYNEPGFLRPSNEPAGALSPASLQYNLNIMKQSLEHAILDHLRPRVYPSSQSSGREMVTAHIRHFYQQHWHRTLRDPLVRLHQRVPGVPSATLQAKLDEIDRAIFVATPSRSVPPPTIDETAGKGTKAMAVVYTEDDGLDCEPDEYDENDDAYEQYEWVEEQHVYEDAYDAEEGEEGDYEDVLDEEYADEEGEYADEEGEEGDYEDVLDEEYADEEGEYEEEYGEEVPADDEDQGQNGLQDHVDINHYAYEAYDPDQKDVHEGNYLDWKVWQRQLYESSSVMLSERQLRVMAQAHVPLEDILVHYFENLDEMMTLA